MRALVAALIVVGAFALLLWYGIEAAVAVANAIPIAPDPHVPLPTLGWCPGGGRAFGGIGGYCDGVPFPDGTYWHQYNVGGWWSMSCNIHDGTAFPPEVPDGCGAGGDSGLYPGGGMGPSSRAGLGTVA